MVCILVENNESDRDNIIYYKYFNQKELNFYLLLITFNLPGPPFFFTYQHSRKKNEKPKYTL